MELDYDIIESLETRVLNKQFSLLFLILIFITQATSYGQIDNDRMDGVYLNIDQYIKNEPETVEFHIYNKSKSEASIWEIFREKSYCLIGVEAGVPAYEIWGFAMHGKSYINYDDCYFPILQYGELSTFYFLEKTTTRLRSLEANYFTLVNTDIEEKVLLVTTDEILDQKWDFPRIVEIIKSDSYFKDKKIKKKEIGMYIAQYNKRHPLSESTGITK